MTSKNASRTVAILGGLALIGAVIAGAVGYRASQGIALTPALGTDPSRGEAKEFAWSSAKPIHAHEYIRPVIEKYLEDLPPGSKVLDLGCGNGALLAHLRGRGWELHGLDISESGITIARKNVPEATFYLADATAPLDGAIAGERFAAIVSTEVIEHVYSPRGLVRNAMQLLEPGGKLVLTTPYHGYFKNLAIAIAGAHDTHYDPLFDHGHIKFWSIDTLSRLLWEVGFERVEYTGAGRLPYLWKSLVMVAHRPSA